MIRVFDIKSFPCFFILKSHISFIYFTLQEQLPAQACRFRTSTKVSIQLASYNSSPTFLYFSSIFCYFLRLNNENICVMQGTPDFVSPEVNYQSCGDLTYENVQSCGTFFLVWSCLNFDFGCCSLLLRDVLFILYLFGHRQVLIANTVYLVLQVLIANNPAGPGHHFVCPAAVLFTNLLNLPSPAGLDRQYSIFSPAVPGHHFFVQLVLFTNLFGSLVESAQSCMS